MRLTTLLASLAVVAAPSCFAQTTPQRHAGNSADTAGAEQASERFDDFLFEFCRDDVFRRSRIGWPITYTSHPSPDYQQRTVEVGADAAHEVSPLAYLSESYCFGERETTVSRIYDNWERELRDTGRRTFYLYVPDSDFEEAYYFERRDGMWYLVGLMTGM